MSLRDDIQIITDKSQADGHQIITPEDRSARSHQIQLDVSGPPSGGTLGVEIRTPGASGYKSIGSMDMTDSEEHVQQFSGFVDSIRLTPVGFDAGLTYSVVVYSTDGVR